MVSNVSLLKKKKKKIYHYLKISFVHPKVGDSAVTSIIIITLAYVFLINQLIIWSITC